MGREEILLKEYQTCQQNINTTASRYWITVGIFIGMNTALWAAIVYKTTSIKFTCNIEWGWIIIPILVTVFGGVMIFIVKYLGRWLDRVNWLMRIKYSRMREIEKELGMRANIYIDSLDNWDRLSGEEKSLGGLVELHRQHPPPAGERDYLIFIYWCLIIVWVALIIMAWLFPWLNIFINGNSLKY